MTQFLAEFWLNIKATTFLEWVGVISGLAYVILAAKKNIWCWLFAFIGSSIYVYLFIIGKLYFESALSVFYVAMAVYGFLSWNKPNAVNQKIIQWKWEWHLINIIVSFCLTFLLGYLADEYTDQANPYVDAFTTVFSLTATFMVAQKALHNWVYWIIIDAVSIFLYYDRGYAMSAVLMFIYTILAFVGWLNWYKIYRAQTT